MYNAATRLYTELLRVYFDDYNSIIDSQKEEMGKNMILLIYLSENMIIVNVMKNHLMKKKNQEEEDDQEEFLDVPSMPLLKGDGEEANEEKELKILAPNKPLTKLAVILTQINARNNS